MGKYLSSLNRWFIANFVVEMIGWPGLGVFYCIILDRPSEFSEQYHKQDFVV